MSATSKPPNWPKNIKVHQREYRNWSQTIDIAQLWTCEPADANEVTLLCNWAKDQKWTIRPKGRRHGWSPLTVIEGTPSLSNVLILDTTKNLTGMTFIPRTSTAPPMVQVQTGATMDALLAFLQQQAGGQGQAPGYSFPHTPAPGDLTIGGVLAIDAHGTAIPSPPTQNSPDNFPASYGSLSNHVMAFTAMVSDPTTGEYAPRTFQRGDADAPVFLAHVGRAFLIDVTLQVIDNYNLRCQSFMNISADTLFQAPTGPSPAQNSLDYFLVASGRVEAIWYPFSTNPWLKVWTVTPTQPAGSKLTTEPYNYAFSDNLPSWITSVLKAVMSGIPSLTPDLERLFAKFTSDELGKNGLSDLWGASRNTLLYIKPETLRVTANGYAVQTRRADVQQAVHDFTTQFTSMLNDYKTNDKYPVNSPLEIRVTALDDTAKVYAPPGTTAKSPLISALSYDGLAQKNGWDVAVWLDVLTLPGTKHSDEFYTELEAWLLKRFTPPQARVFPEWSKGWAYTATNGAWSNIDFLAMIRQNFTVDRDSSDNWNREVATLKSYDRSNLFTNSFLETLFTPV